MIAISRRATAFRRSYGQSALAFSNKSVDSESLKAADITPKKTPVSEVQPQKPLPMSWSDYFSHRKSRNMIRPIIGIPASISAFTAVATLVPFSPFTPIIGMDPAFAFTFVGLISSALAYQVGAVGGHVLWRIKNPPLAKQMDRMDKVFFDKIKLNRAERGRSPYVYSTESGSSAIKSVMLTQQKNSNAGSASGGGNREDFYGEKIKSVGDYRRWLRRQRKSDRDSGAK